MAGAVLAGVVGEPQFGVPMRITALLVLLSTGCPTAKDTAASETGGGNDSADNLGGEDTANDGYDDGACVSGEEWTGGNEESPYMNPGEACIACHTKEREGPSFAAAGTVYFNYDEPDDCNGVKTATVRITDADGEVYEEETNKAGNFYFLSSDYRIKTPYTAEVEFKDGKIATMVDDQKTGDCNGCHTQSGKEDAPGRIAESAAE